MRQTTRPTVICLLLSLAATLALAKAPPTPVQPVTESLHGVELVDPYRWLEGSDAPEIAEPDPELDRRVAKWTEKQNANTREVLDHLPGRQALEARLGELLTATSISAPRVRGERYFYQERSGSQAQSVLYVREGAEGEPRVLLDPNQVDADGLTALSWFTPDRNGERLAFGLYRGGDENATLYLMDVGSGEWLAEEIPGKVRRVSWLPDGSGFLYNCLEDVGNPYSSQIKFHKIGRHHRQDPVLFEQYKEGPLATTWGPSGYLDEDGRWLVLTYFTGTESNDLWFYDFRHWLSTGELERQDLMTGEAATASGPVVGDTMYLQTTLDAPNGRVVAVDLNRPGREHWREIVPERGDAVVEDVSVAGDLMAVSYVARAVTRIDLFDLAGGARGTLDLPGLGSGRLRTESDRTEAFLTFESYHLPETIYRVDLAGGERSVWAASDLPVTPEALTVEQVTYRSKDGTPVTMFLAHRKGLVRDGRNPTLLTGYGGFNVSSTPSFRAVWVPWLEAGGVMAVANLRGGGEYGEAWHRAGMLDHKQNVFDDFIAAAEWLIDHRYTNSGQLGISGGSNGGLLTGAALVQRPDLFSAVISAVPLLDMLRYQNFLMARFWVPEYGTAEDPEQLPFLLAYSPYHNVEKGVKYPAVLLTAGENDARVHPLHARKMAARLQAATANGVEREPILLWVEGEVGHGRGKPLSIRQRESADSLAFMGWQLGLSWGEGSAAKPAAAAASPRAAEPAGSEESGSAGSPDPLRR